VTIDPDRCWWFGCWLEAGHHLVGRGGTWDMRRACPLFCDEHLLDGGYAPRQITSWHRLGVLRSEIAFHPDGLCFQAMGRTREERQAIHYASDELPQGKFLFHVSRGCSLIAWWDRTQGDERSACNSTFIAEGAHTAADLLAAFPQIFPLQAKRLADAGVALVCVNLGLTGMPNAEDRK
jgi:hypothetical protein